ncbi:MAG: DUF1634 domain-containing protein [Candidatus Desulfofervidus auxilii]|nr:DUF1634 domain-containing protein [Candidatus Desulfofervidus auxilii]
MQEKPKAPLAGIVYGEIVYWITFIGMIVAVIGAAIYLFGGPQYAKSSCVLSLLWEGEDVHEIWEKCAGHAIHGHWYLKKLGSGDGLGMLGIAFSCIAAVVGVWVSAFTMLKEKEKILYPFLAFIVAVILTLSALGIISLKH